jgi:hypothetical protein
MRTALFGLLLLCPPLSTGSLSVDVRDENGAALTGIDVQLYQERESFGDLLVTGANGRVTFQGVPAGTYKVRIDQPGYVSAEQEVTLGPGATALVSFVLMASSEQPVGSTGGFGLESVGASEVPLSGSWTYESAPVLESAGAASFDMSLEAFAAESLLPQSNETEAGLVWNLWVATAPGPKFSPIKTLKPNANYLVVLDLSGLSYATQDSNVLAAYATERFQAEFDSWLGIQDLPDLALDVTLVSIDGGLSIVGRNTETMVLDLERARAFSPKRGTRQPTPTMKEVARLHPEFQFGRVVFNLETGAKQGRRALAMSVWSQTGVPLEEIGFEVCIADSDQHYAERCGDAHGALTTNFVGIDSVRAAAENPSYPDLSLHVMAPFPDRSVAVVLKNNQSGDIFNWSLGLLPGQLEAQLLNAVRGAIDSAKDDAAMAAAGSALVNLLFTSESGEKGARAAKAFRMALTGAADSKPTLFVRGIGALPLVFPIQLMAFDDRFVAGMARVEMPLPIQLYGSNQPCIDAWTMVSPPPGVSDAALTRVREQASGYLEEWEATTHHYSDLADFGTWIKDGEDGEQALFFIGHHEADAFRFESEGRRLISSGIGRSFSAPSLAILNGCGTAASPGNDLVRRLNRMGMSGLVATAANIEAEMAGDFVECLDTTLIAGDQGSTLRDLYDGMLDCLSQKVDSKSRPWGARRFKYLLVGNGAIRVCRPRGVAGTDQ